MEAQTIRSRNDVIDALSHALKMAGYINDDGVRKAVENTLTDSIVDVIADFNTEGDVQL